MCTPHRPILHTPSVSTQCYKPSHRRQCYMYTYTYVRVSLQFCVSSQFFKSRGRAHTVSGTHTPTHSSQRAPSHTHSHTTHSSRHALSCPKPLSLFVGTSHVVPQLLNRQRSRARTTGLRAGHPVFCSRLRREEGGFDKAKVNQPNARTSPIRRERGGRERFEQRLSSQIRQG